METWQFFKWRRLDAKLQTLHDSIYMKYEGRQISRYRKPRKISDFLGLDVRGWLKANWHEKFFCGNRSFLKQDYGGGCTTL